VIGEYILGKKKVEKLRGDIRAIREVLIPISGNPHHKPGKNEPFSQEMRFKDTAFKPGFEIVKF
jgi:hypothetical protein